MGSAAPHYHQDGRLAHQGQGQGSGKSGRLRRAGRQQRANRKRHAGRGDRETRAGHGGQGRCVSAVRHGTYANRERVPATAPNSGSKDHPQNVHRVPILRQPARRHRVRRVVGQVGVGPRETLLPGRRPQRISSSGVGGGAGGSGGSDPGIRAGLPPMGGGRLPDVQQ